MSGEETDFSLLTPGHPEKIKAHFLGKCCQLLLKTTVDAV
jgi:hypothetical protein